jgi:hypothetical protein
MIRSDYVKKTLIFFRRNYKKTVRGRGFDVISVIAAGIIHDWNATAKAAAPMIPLDFAWAGFMIGG